MTDVSKIIEVVGTSKKSWEDAATNAIKAAGEKKRLAREARERAAWGEE